MILKRLITPLLLLLFTSTLFAQQFRVKADIDSTQLFIGEQAKLTFTIEQNNHEIVFQPIFSDTIVTGLEIVEVLKSDTQFVNSEMLRIEQSYIVTGFDSALIFIPPYAYEANEEIQYSNPLSLKIISFPIDTTQQSITDIKTVYAPPFDWELFFNIILIIILVGLLVLGGYFLYKRYKKNKVSEDVMPEAIDIRPAHEIAFQQLEGLRVAHLWEDGRIKEYYTQIADILREYLHRRYFLSTMESTSEDIFKELKQQKVLSDKDNFDIVKSVLQISDLVKFAKLNPSSEEHDRVFKQIYQFVDNTKQLPQEEVCENFVEEEPEK